MGRHCRSAIKQIRLAQGVNGHSMFNQSEEMKVFLPCDLFHNFNCNYPSQPCYFILTLLEDLNTVATISLGQLWFIQ